MSHQNRLSVSRRSFVRGGLAASAALWTPGVFAEELMVTPQLTEGPFYPDKLPLDTDNDLIVINDSTTPSVGEVTHLTGRILSKAGSPIRNAMVEIWQVDGNGVYLHTGDGRKELADANFQGYGRFLTDSKGQYYFRTIKPVPYPGRTPHIHVAVSQNGKRIYTTQLLVNGHDQNERDGVFRAVRDSEERKALLVDFNPLQDSTIGELAANFDVVLGFTPEDNHDAIKGAIGKPEWNQRRNRRG